MRQSSKAMPDEKSRPPVLEESPAEHRDSCKGRFGTYGMNWVSDLSMSWDKGQERGIKKGVINSRTDDQR